MDPLLEYACKRIAELEGLLLVEVPETVWPAEVGMVFSQIEVAGDLPVHHQPRLQHHINRMWLVVTFKLLDTTVGQVSGKIKSV